MKKLSLKELKVKSFVTQLSDGKVQTVKGGKTAVCGLDTFIESDVATTTNPMLNYTKACNTLRCGTGN